MPAPLLAALGLAAGFFGFVAWDQSAWWRAKPDHAFIWLAAGDPMVPDTITARFADRGADWWLSAASVWEMAVKASLGKLALGTTLERLVEGGRERGIKLLPITAAHAYLVQHLPFHHRDPFDRMLVAQAQHEGLRLVSKDATLDAYAVERVWG